MQGYLFIIRYQAVRVFGLEESISLSEIHLRDFVKTDGNDGSTKATLQKVKRFDIDAAPRTGRETLDFMNNWLITPTKFLL
jgi:hypothetical protein